MTLCHHALKRDTIAPTITSMIARIHERMVNTTLVAVRDKFGGRPDCCRNSSMVKGDGVAGTMVGVNGRVGVATAGCDPVRC